MSSHSQPIGEVICPVCGFHNRSSFRVCHGCATWLRPDERIPSKTNPIALRSLRGAVTGWPRAAAKLALLRLLGGAILLASLICIGPEARPRDPAVAVEPAASVVLTDAPRQPASASMQREAAVAFHSQSNAPILYTLVDTISERPGSPSPEAAYMLPLSLTVPSGTIILLPMPFGLEGPGLTAALASVEAATVELARDQVITYTVQPGDTVVAIARKFGLTPHTVFWSNAEAMQDDPRRLSVGTVLTILPLNGVYHVATADETLAELAEEFAVQTETLYNEWNPLLEGQALTAGMALVIPGGQGGVVPWKEATTSIGDSGSAWDLDGSGLCGGELQGVPGRGSFDWPTDEHQISGWYFHDAWNPTHGGIDIQLNTGDPVYAADGGAISFAGWWTLGGYGNLVVVDHLNGWTTWYGHLSQVDVVCAQQVNAGDIIGLGGSTGWSTGPHLHFEMRLEGVPQDPLIYLP